MLDQAPNLYIKARNLIILGGLLLIATSAYLGRIPVFLFFNTDGGALMDQFFKWGMVEVPTTKGHGNTKQMVPYAAEMFFARLR